MVVDQLLPNASGFSRRIKSVIGYAHCVIGTLLAAAVLFVNAGTFELTAIATLSASAKTIVLLGILFAAWGKSAQLPMHMWLPDAMNAPTPVSAYLHAASMVKVGVYILLAEFYRLVKCLKLSAWLGLSVR